jgi:peptidyl-tRNA hydrolase, PTH1 family
MIRLIVGLGNPGSEYEATRHNAGFWWVDALAARLGARLVAERAHQGLVARVNRRGADPLWLLEPMTYMNRSGVAVASLARFYKIAPAQVLVVHDELDLPPGQARLKLGGSAAGHNGLKDIQHMLGSPDFWRLRLGIGHPGDRAEVVNYVLKKPAPDQRDAITIAIERSLQSADLLLDGEMDKAVAQIHAKPPRPKPPRRRRRPPPHPPLARPHPPRRRRRPHEDRIERRLGLVCAAHAVRRAGRAGHALGGAADDVALRTRRPGLHRPPLCRRRRRRAGTAADAAGAGRGARGVGARARGRRAAGAGAPPPARRGAARRRRCGRHPAAAVGVGPRCRRTARPRRRGAPRPPWRPKSSEPCGRQRPSGLGVARRRTCASRCLQAASTAVNRRQWPSSAFSRSTLASNWARVSMCAGSTGMQLTGQTCTHCGSSKWPTHSVQRAGSMT